MPSRLPEVRDRQKAKFLENYKRTGDKAASASAANVNASTIWRWFRKDPEFNSAMLEVEEMNLDRAESELLKLVKAGEFRAIRFFLVSKGGRRGWGEKLQLEHTSKHEVIDVKRLEILLKNEEARKELEILASNPDKIYEISSNDI